MPKTRVVVASLVLALVAACGGTKAKLGSAGRSCKADECEHYAVACSDGSATVEGGCGNDACLSRDEATADSCADSSVAAIVVVPAGETAMPDTDASTAMVDAGPPPASSVCSDNTVYLTQLDRTTQDCTALAETCREDKAQGNASCEDVMVGDECFVEGDLSCLDNGMSAAVCKDGAWTATDLECLDSPGYCYSASTNRHDIYTCGTFEKMRDYSQVGTACPDDKRSACSFDRKTVHKCVDGAWAEAIHCGETACQKLNVTNVSNGYYGCSNGGYSVNDLCSFAEGGVTCSTDLTQVLQCVSGRLALFQTCSAGQECRDKISNGKLVRGCGPSGYVVGDRCHFPEGFTVCTADLTQVLECKADVMALKATCDAPQQCQADEANGVPIVTCK